MRCFLVCFAFAFALQGQGAFLVCNQTDETIDTAYAVYYLKRDPVTFAQIPQFESHGWVVLTPGKCAPVDPSGYRKVWLAGFGSGGSEWGGVSTAPTFCVHFSDAFHFDEQRFPNVHRSEQACKARGGELVTFSEHFGGMENYTVNFSPAPRQPKDDSVPTTPPSRKVYDPDTLEPSYVPERKTTTHLSPLSRGNSLSSIVT
jgi:hypothetical protein